MFKALFYTIRCKTGSPERCFHPVFPCVPAFPFILLRLALNLSGLSLHPLCKAPHGFLAVMAVAERSEAHISLAARTEAHARRAYNLCSVEQLFEEFPAVRAFGCLHPKVWGVDASVYLEAELLQRLVHQSGVAHVVIDGCLCLSLSFGSVYRCGGALADVACAVELGALAAIRFAFEGDLLALYRYILPS